MKPGRPKDMYNVFPKRNTRNIVSNKIRNICNGIKAKISKDKDPDKKAMWAIIGRDLLL